MSVIPDPERRRRAREPAQPTTFHQFAQSNSDETSGGRFAKQEGSTPQVVGADGPPTCPALPSSSPWSGEDPVPDEPPLGININAMPELGQNPTGLPMSQPVATGVAEAPLGPRQVVEHAAPPSSSLDDDSTVLKGSPRSTHPSALAGSPPSQEEQSDG
jgi:hypothetical protein